MMNVSVQHEASRTVLVIGGNLDAATAGELRPVVDKLVEDKVSLVVVDLNGLRLIDSSGVAVLVGLFKRMKAQGGAVRIENLKDQPLAIFKLLRLDKVFTP